ncbi:MAG: agmatinase family protein [Bacteroidia bacterium]|nr:agmatinase family protein [Bacteroidia bacterium]
MTQAKTFNPNDPGTSDSNVFGLPYKATDADLVIIPVPWEATVSYGAGTIHGPEAILEASKQIDLYHPLIKEVWKHKMAIGDEEPSIRKLSKETRKFSKEIIETLAEGKEVSAKKTERVNEACEAMVQSVRVQALQWMKKGKFVASLGGDHSTPLGLMQALATKHQFGILQIDAHCDLRNAYEGFQYSHASIMYNALKEKKITSLTQVGIRDYCEEEVAFIAKNKSRVIVFFDRDIQQKKMEGTLWAKQVAAIVKTLPPKVFISFDIDGLTPDHCPNTGTPVPGGLSFAEVTYLIEKVAQSGKQIIGFDLNEVSPGRHDDWDANVGARVLFLLCCSWMINRKKNKRG